MPLIRGRHSFDNQFTQIPNHWLRDSRLSLKSIGLLAQIMSHTPGWSLSIEMLAKQNDCGKDTIRSAIKELESAGYLVRRQPKDDMNRFQEMIWETCDPGMVEPVTDEPDTENPYTENPTPKNTIYKEQQVKNIRRASQISENFEPSDELLAWAKTNGITVDVRKQTQMFINYYIANGKPMKNWDAAWRNWMLKTNTYEKPVWEKAKDVQAVESRLASERSREVTAELIEEQRRAAEVSAPPPVCEHGKILALCLPCAKRLN